MAFSTDFFTGCDGLIVCLAQWANEVTFGLFWTLILLGFVTILFMASFRFQTPRAFGFATTTGTFGAIFLATLGLMNWWIASIFIIVGAVGLAVMLLNER